MRREDRALTSKEEWIDVFNLGKAVQIAFIDGNEPYIVTMNYGYSWIASMPKLYLHSAPEGRKIDCIRKNPRVCFSISIPESLTEAQNACGYGMKYRSVVGYGSMKIVESTDERIAGLNLLMNHYTAKGHWEFDTNTLKNTMVICLDVGTLSGKRKM